MTDPEVVLEITLAPIEFGMSPQAATIQLSTTVIPLSVTDTQTPPLSILQAPNQVTVVRTPVELALSVAPMNLQLNLEGPQGPPGAPGSGGGGGITYDRSAIAASWVYRGGPGWRVDRWPRPGGTGTMTTATILNNASFSTLDAAWAERANLVYS